MRLDAELLKKTGVFALVSSELITTIGGGFLLGNYLDGKWGTKPIFGFGLALLGLVYSVWRIHGLSKRWLRDGKATDGTRRTL